MGKSTINLVSNTGRTRMGLTFVLGSFYVNRVLKIQLVDP